MKKLFILLIAALFSIATFGQTATTVNNETAKNITVSKTITAIPVSKDKDSMTMTVKTMPPEKIAETIMKQDSALHEQSKTIDAKDSTIIKKDEQIKSLKSDIEKNLLGDVSLADMISCFIIAFIAMFCRWCYKTIKSIKKNPKTPSAFNLVYWIKDNAVIKLLSVGLTIAGLYLAFRFFGKWFADYQEITMFGACLVGLFFDYVIDYIMNLNPAKVLVKALPASEVAKITNAPVDTPPNTPNTPTNTPPNQ